MPPQNGPEHRRRRPRQARARMTVDAILEGAARVFRREGWNATTNRIALEAGVSVGSLYEYFPNKQALLVALAERHVQEAEGLLTAALQEQLPTAALLARVQAGIIACQRYPSHALALVREDSPVGAELRARVGRLERAVLDSLCERARASGLSEPELRARACFDVIGPLTARALFETPETCQALAREYLVMAVAHLGA